MVKSDYFQDSENIFAEKKKKTTNPKSQFNKKKQHRAEMKAVDID